MKKLSRTFYLTEDAVEVARNLLGKVLVTNVNNKRTSGIICETEAYNGVNDRASHAYGNRRTKRTEIMYSNGGTAYIYLCYGIHCLFNVVTNKKDVPHAVLIRKFIPLDGVDRMLQRRRSFHPKRGKTPFRNGANLQKLITGPGTVCQALGLNLSHNGTDLLGNEVWIENGPVNIDSRKIISSPRIGINYAGPDALLPYRFEYDFTMNPRIE